MTARALLQKLDDAMLAVCLGLGGGTLFVIAALLERF